MNFERLSHKHDGIVKIIESRGKEVNKYTRMDANKCECNTSNICYSYLCSLQMARGNRKTTTIVARMNENVHNEYKYAINANTNFPLETDFSTLWLKISSSIFSRFIFKVRIQIWIKYKKFKSWDTCVLYLHISQRRQVILHVYVKANEHFITTQNIKKMYWTANWTEPHIINKRTNKHIKIGR